MTSVSLSDAGKVARTARGLLGGGGVLALVSLGLLFLAPETWLGMDSGKIGFALLWPAVVILLLGFSMLPVRANSRPVALGEKHAMLSLVVVVLAAAYLFTRAHAMGWDADPRSRALGHVAVHLVLLLVGSAVLAEILRRRERGVAVEDERDLAIRHRASMAGYTTLVVLLMVAAVTAGLSLAPWFPVSSPLALALALIGMLMLSEIVRHAAEIRLYRRDRM